MRLTSARVEKYRCLRDVTVPFDDLTVLVGANGTGKSTVLRGINWFFNGGQLEADDVWRHEAGATVRISATFSEFTDADREALGSYAVGETATFTRTWSEVDGEKLTGRAFTYPPFDQIRGIDGAVPRRAAYNALVDAGPDLGLAQAPNQAEMNTHM